MRRLLIISGIAAVHFVLTVIVTVQAAFAGDFEGEVPVTSSEKALQTCATILNFPVDWLLWEAGLPGKWWPVSLAPNGLLWGTGMYYLGGVFFRKKPDLKAA